MGQLGNDAKRYLAIDANKYGTSATITRQLATAYNTATSTATVVGTTITVKGSFKNPNRGAKGDRGDGVSIASTDIAINTRIFVIPMLDTSMAELSFTPAIGDQITIGGVKYSIRGIDPYFTDSVRTQMDLFIDQA